MPTIRYDIRQGTLDDGRVLLERFRNYDGIPSLDTSRVDFGGGPPQVVRAMAVASAERREYATKIKQNMIRLTLACKGLLLPDDFFDNGALDVLERGEEILDLLLEYAAGNRGDDDGDEDYDVDDKDEDDDDKKDDEDEDADGKDDGIDDE
jgi:hypothetical protein